jgi:hypothetical protein
MTYTTIVTQVPGDPWTSTKFNEYVKGNVEHLAGMLVGGVALSAKAGGSELLPSVSSVVYTETRASTGAFTDITLSGLSGYSAAIGFELEYGIRSAHVTGFVDPLVIWFNNDTAANYHSQRLGALDGAAVVAEASDSAIGTIPNANSPANSFGQGVVRVNDFKNANMLKIANHKGLSYLDTNSSRNESSNVLWKSAAAITSVRLASTSANPVQYSYLRLRFIF